MSSMEQRILAKAASDDVSDLYNEVQEFLKPMKPILGFSDETKENFSNKAQAQIRPLAKRFVPFLAPLMKACCDNLTRRMVPDDEAEQRRATELFSILKFSLECFDAMRPCLVGSPCEIEVQRYWMVRRLMAWKRFPEALAECWKTLDSLRLNVLAASNVGTKILSQTPLTKKDVPAASTRRPKMKHSRCDLGVNLFGERAADADASLVALMVGLVTDLIICTGESRIHDADVYGKVPLLVQQLIPWVKYIDTCTVEKQNNMVFKGLHKCAQFMIAEYSLFGSQAVRDVCLLALKFCANATLKDRLIKVTCGICHNLISTGADVFSLVEDAYKTTLNAIFKDTQMWKQYSEREIVDVLEFFSHHAQLNSELRRNAKKYLHEIAELLEQVTALPLAAVVHIYAISLGFKDLEDSNPGEGSTIVCKKIVHTIKERRSKKSIFCKGDDDLKLLSSIIKYIESGIDDFKHENEDFIQRFEEVLVLSDSVKWKGTSLVSIFVSLECLLKASVGFVQKEWDLFVANQIVSAVTWNLSLGQSFHLLSQVFLVSLSCDSVSSEGKKEVEKGRQAVLLAVISALRLCLIRSESVEEHFESISSIMTQPCIDLQNLMWMSTSTYNIGVQMYNLKKYSEAVVPLKLAHNAAWLRVKMLVNNLPTQVRGKDEVKIESDSTTESISDALGKSHVLISSLEKCEDKTARTTVIDCFRRWYKVDAHFPASNNLHSLVQSWVKITWSNYKDLDTNEVCVEGLTLCKALFKAGCSLTCVAQGKILEEELFAYCKIEDTFSRAMQTKIISMLLEDVYVTKEFSLERSRILLQRCKEDRRGGPTGLSNCLTSLSDAFSCLRDCLESSNRNENKCGISGVHHQLAITYCVHAFCIQEVDSDAEVICNDIESALENWYKVLNSNCVRESLMNTAIPLLRSMSDLLALKGFTYLQSDVQKMIVKIISSIKNANPKECCAVLWRDSRLNHVLCCSYLSGPTLFMLTEVFGCTVNSIEFWEDCIQGLSGSTLELHRKIIFEDIFKNCSKKNSGDTLDLLETKVPSLLLDGPKTSNSTLRTSNFLFALAQFYQQKGKLGMALKHSKMSLNMRKQICQTKFKFLDNGSAENGMFHVEPAGHVAVNSWPTVYNSEESKENGFSQCTVLGLYLESLMQAGVLFEMTGAVDDAEYFFQEGLNISNAQRLPLGQVSFSSCLGEVYRKRHLWEASSKAMEHAMNVLQSNEMRRVCQVCRAAAQALLEMRVGDLLRRCPMENIYGPNLKRMSSAIEAYSCAREKLNFLNLEFDDSLSLCVNQRTSLEKKTEISGKALPPDDVVELYNEITRINLGERASSNMATGKIAAGSNERAHLSIAKGVDTVNSCIKTRSQMRKSRNNNTVDCSRSCDNNDLNEHDNIHRNTRSSRRRKVLAPSIREKEHTLLSKTPAPSKRCLMKGKIVDEKQQVHACVSYVESNKIFHKLGSMQEFLSLQIDVCRRSLLSRVLTQMGKFYLTEKKYEKVQEVLSENISLLSFETSENTCLCSFGSCGCKCSAKESTVKMFTIEWAVLLYHISWFSLCKGAPVTSWIRCCSFAEKQRPFLVNWLRYAFFLSGDMPAALRKVSLLLALVHLPSESGGLFAASHEHIGCLSTNLWAVYFHQASIGTSSRQEHHAMLDKRRQCSPSVNEGYFLESYMVERMEKCLRAVPESMETIEIRVKGFFENLPSLTFACISFLDSRYAGILGDLESDGPPTWIFLSHFGPEAETAAVLLPVVATFKGTSKDDFLQSNISPFTFIDSDDDCLEENDLINRSVIKHNSCNVVDTVAEEFRLLLEESSDSTSKSFMVESYEDIVKWWQWRRQLDYRLAKLLRGIEDHWLGPWKCFLLGGLLEDGVSEVFDKNISRLLQALESSAKGIKSKWEIQMDKAALKVLLGAVTSLTFGEILNGVCLLLCCQSHSCVQCCKKLQNLLSEEISSVSQLSFSRTLSTQTNFCGDCQNIIQQVVQILWSIFQDLGLSTSEEYSGPELDIESQKSSEDSSCLNQGLGNREPVVLILDSNSQVLPWESLPILRKHEVYRMPSVGSALALMLFQGSQSCGIPDQLPAMPVVDPYNAFYLLNPSGDLRKTQTTFEEWFKNQKGWQGKIGEVPTQEEYRAALQLHDLFLYLGHGNGEQYLSRRMIKRLNRCAAAMLMGCSSGKLSSRGDYEPVGLPLFYLMAGCPSIVSNLWDVTDGDIDRFSRVLLNNWLQSVSKDATDLNTCNTQDSKTHMGSFLSSGRDMCKLRYLIGAAPVCYGVPTLIKTKRT